MAATEFTDSNGAVYLHGRHEPTLTAVGVKHLNRCPHKPGLTDYTMLGCECGGPVVMGWASFWGTVPPSESVALKPVEGQ